MIDIAIIGIIIIGLIINLILNLITNKTLFANEENKKNYFIIWTLAGVALLIVSLIPERMEKLTLLLYGIVGFSSPQLAVYLMTINDLKTTMTGLETKKTQSDQLLEKIRTKLLFNVADIQEAGKKKENGETCQKVISEFIRKADTYEQSELLTADEKIKYLETIALAIDCRKELENQIGNRRK